MTAPVLFLNAVLLVCTAGALAACGPAATQAPNWGLTPSEERGRTLLAQYQCGSCHTIPDVAAAQGRVGPALGGFGMRSYIAGHIPNSQEALARWIMDPPALAPGTVMPNMGVTLVDARAMAAFLHAVR